MNINSTSLPKKEKSSKNRHKRSRSEGASSVLGKVSWTKNIKSSTIDLLAESFYSVKYGSLNITLIVPSNNLFCFMSFQMGFS